MFEPEPSVPIVPRLRRAELQDLPPRKVKQSYPWKTILVGESFLVPTRTIRQIHCLIFYQQTHTSCRYRARTVPGGVRVWRVS